MSSRDEKYVPGDLVSASFGFDVNMYPLVVYESVEYYGLRGLPVAVAPVNSTGFVVSVIPEKGPIYVVYPTDIGWARSNKFAVVLEYAE